MSPGGCHTGPRFPGPAGVGLVLALAGCGAVVHDGPSAMGDRGTLQFALEFVPPPALGAFELRVGVTSLEGPDAVALSSCSIDVVMPSHGHEAAGATVARVDGSSCVLPGRSFQMSGAWRVRVEATTDAGVDGATFAVEVP